MHPNETKRRLRADTSHHDCLQCEGSGLGRFSNLGRRVPNSSILGDSRDQMELQAARCPLGLRVLSSDKYTSRSTASRLEELHTEVGNVVDGTDLAELVHTSRQASLMHFEHPFR